MILEGADIRGDVRERCDVLVIGSGGGGGPFAYQMAKAGLSVVVVEAGGYHTSADFSEREGDMTRKLYVEGGAQGVDDGSLPIFQGKCVGGSTVINGMICFRPPEWVLDRWAREHGVSGLSMREFLPSIEEVEGIVHAKENGPHEINRANRLLMEGAGKLGWHAAPVHRNVTDCILSGFCQLGCAYDRKRSVLVTFIPLACELGARLYADATVERITAEGGRATGAIARVRDRRTGKRSGRLHIDAKIVAVAAGAIQTPCLLERSGMGGPAGVLGEHFSVHPSTVVTGVFDERLEAWHGAAHGAYSGAFHSHDKGGFLIEGINVWPIGTSLFVGQMGRAHRELMEQYPHMASSVSIVHDEGLGSVHYDEGRRKARIRYRLDEDHERRIKASIERMAELWFAAGARRVVTQFTNPLILESPDEIAKVGARSAGPHALDVASYHPMGTARMGGDPTRSYVRPTGECHGVRNLFVVDTSAFPTSVDVNPQITVMSLATHFAKGILAERSRYF
ncbi:MAG: GMC family oxidoreductase [Myxococcales bacterium]|nr:GMC family oxidoreductase [Myxococcales bacterium]